MKKIALNGLLISLALVLSYIESLFPTSLIIPIPGVRLGLANIVTMFALFYLGFVSAMTISVLRCVLAALMFGGLSSLMFSLSGALLALIIMQVLKYGYNKLFSILGISIGGAAAHNTGQILMASLMMRNTAIFAYLPILLLAGMVMGFVTAVVAQNLFYLVDKTHVVKHLG
ncbi:MAG: Gx transporter family protein [Clostridiaceae bacterium]|jgi:heptaprenyl diphosphate synthase|nr:Gx transporter family protein [Bacillota bacterium]NLI39061.1 Gx transporter family protein [Clostridiaceae bacterium]